MGPIVLGALAQEGFCLKEFLSLGLLWAFLSVRASVLEGFSLREFLSWWLLSWLLLSKRSFVGHNNTHLISLLFLSFLAIEASDNNFYYAMA